jgi:hypothetical protein
MRLFHELIFDQFIEGATGFGGLTQPLHWAPILGAVDTMRFMLLADHVSGTLPDLQVLILQRPELTDLFTSPLIPLFAKTLTPGQTDLLTGSVTPSDSDAPGSYHYHVYVSLNGTAPRARIRIWVTGRGRA